MKQTFFYTGVIGFASGIFFRSFFDYGWSTVLLVFLLGVVFFCVHILLRAPFPYTFLLFAIFFALSGCGLLRLHVAEEAVSPLLQYVGEEVSIVGVVSREPERRETTAHLYVVPEGTDEYVLVTADVFSVPEVSYGDTVRVRGVLELPEAFVTDGGRVFDYPAYLKARGVGVVLPFADVAIEQKSSSFLTTLFSGKEKFIASIERSVHEPFSGLGEGILLGVKRALPEELEAIFRETGIIHIVVLSGYNIMIIVGALMYVLTRFFLPRTRMVIGLSVVTLFVILVGPSATVIRAGIMAGLALIAQGTGRTYQVLRALMLAGMCMLIINPYLLVHDPGFQLSFLATLGLILLSPHIEKRLTMVPECIGIRGFVTATLSTQLFVLPLLLYQTGLFPVVSVFVNVLVLPMVPVAMFLTFLTGLVGLILPVLGSVVGFFAHLSLLYIITVAELFGTLPFASFSIPAFPFGLTVFMYILLVLWVVFFISNDLPTIPINGNSGEVKNEYAGWVIEEETETPPEVQSTSGGVKISK